jgi:lysyl-tRNA synthetase class 2
MAWKPTASIETLKARAEILAQVRRFFAERGILEVETPLLSRYSVTDRYMKSFQVNDFMGGEGSGEGYLQTSPEYAMKRLLAAGSGSIYQICKAFRQDELGRRHNPEFTMLEWYLEGCDHEQLMGQVFELLDTLSNKTPNRASGKASDKVSRNKLNKRSFSYREVFEEYLNIDPFVITDEELKSLSLESLGELPEDLERDDYLALLFEERIEPFLGMKQGQGDEVCFIHSYPVSQAALARVDESNPEIACRFEVYWQGVELANGFYELDDPEEQHYRFEADNQWRKDNQLPQMSIDERFMAGLEHGLPDCAGVALGLDRLVMILLQKNSLQEVLTFPADRA